MVRFLGSDIKSGIGKLITDHEFGGFQKADCPPHEYATRRGNLLHHLRLLWQLHIVPAANIKVELYSRKGYDYAKIFNKKGELRGYLMPRDKNNRFKLVILRKGKVYYERSFKSPESFQVCVKKEMLKELFKE